MTTNDHKKMPENFGTTREVALNYVGAVDAGDWGTKEFHLSDLFTSEELYAAIGPGGSDPELQLAAEICTENTCGRHAVRVRLRRVGVDAPAPRVKLSTESRVVLAEAEARGKHRALELALGVSDQDYNALLRRVAVLAKRDDQPIDSGTPPAVASTEKNASARVEDPGSGGPVELALGLVGALVITPWGPNPLVSEARTGKPGSRVSHLEFTMKGIPGFRATMQADACRELQVVFDALIGPPPGRAGVAGIKLSAEDLELLRGIREDAASWSMAHAERELLDRLIAVGAGARL